MHRLFVAKIQPNDAPQPVQQVRNATGALAQPATAVEQRDCMLHHFALVVERFGVEKGTLLMRKFACCYAQGRHGARHFRAHVSRVNSPEEFNRVVEQYFPMDA